MDPQSFDEWLEQIDMVASLTNKDPYKLTLAKSQGLFSRTISLYPPSLEQNQRMIMLQFWLCSYQTTCSVNANVSYDHFI